MADEAQGERDDQVEAPENVMTGIADKHNDCRHRGRSKQCFAASRGCANLMVAAPISPIYLSARPMDDFLTQYSSIAARGPQGLINLKLKPSQTRKLRHLSYLNQFPQPD